MSGLKVFISSTCYDLASHREHLRSLLAKMGVESVMSDRGDVLFDPREHTHTSCLLDVPQSDMMIVLIGGRFGGSTVPDALTQIDMDEARKSSSKSSLLDDPRKLSITQAEVLKAAQHSIPIWVFVDSHVHNDHHVYERNKASGMADRITYPSIEKSNTSSYIFEFITFISHRISNNAVFTFSSFSDIETNITKQWSLFFQRLLQEQRTRDIEKRQSDVLIEQIEGLKTVLLQSISSGASRETARAVLKFRSMADFASSLSHGNIEPIVEFKGKFSELLINMNVVDWEEINDTHFSKALILKKSDSTFFVSKLNASYMPNFSAQWDEFKKLDRNVKEAVLDAVSESRSGFSFLTHHTEDFESWKANQPKQNSLSSAMNLFMDNKFSVKDSASELTKDSAPPELPRREPKSGQSASKPKRT